MSKNTNKRKVTIRTVRRDPPDLRKLSRALIALTIAQSEADAEAQVESDDKPAESPKKKRRGP
jgi:hypothetical protein